MATNPQFIEQRFIWTANLTNQTSSRDTLTTANGGAVQLGVASGKGALLEEIWLQPLGNISANVARLFVRKAGATTLRLVRELTISAVSGSTDAAAIASTQTQYDALSFWLPDILTPTGSFGLALGAGDTLLVALGTASGVGINVMASGGHYESGTGTP